jgi:OOP family OmpA-OmpF porin
MLQIGPEIYGTTLMVGSDRFTRATTNLEGILGLRVNLAGFVLGAGAGPGFTHGLGTPALRALLSVAYAPEPAPPPPPPPPATRRRSRLIAITTASRTRMTPAPTSQGYPATIPRRTVARRLRPTAMATAYLTNDACPDVKGVASSDPNENGCPPDTDGDGIRDDVDACPNEKGPADSDPQKNGCPRAVRVTTVRS